MGKVLGVGGYSTVYECKKESFDFKFALKIVKADSNIYDRNAVYYLFNEVSVLENMSEFEGL